MITVKLKRPKFFLICQNRIKIKYKNKNDKFWYNKIKEIKESVISKTNEMRYNEVSQALMPHIDVHQGNLEVVWEAVNP